MPDFTVITHWHYDHTFGMCAINGISIAYEKTNEFLKDQQEQAKSANYIAALKQEDVHFRKEYRGCDRLNIVLSDITFSDKVELGSGRYYRPDIPHSIPSF